MKKNKDELVRRLVQQGLLPLYYNADKNTSIDLMRTLYKGGIRIFEYTNRGENALENFKELIKIRNAEMMDLSVGIGTIKSLADAESFYPYADFFVAPIVNCRVAEFANENKMLWIPGCMTPTEIHLAQECQAIIIKLFPANILGVNFLQSIKDLFSHQLFIPTGGVEIEEKNLQAWFDAGVCAVGMGSKLLQQKWIEEKKYTAILDETKKALQLIKLIKETKT